MSELLPAMCIFSVISNTVQKTIRCIEKHTEAETNHTVNILKVHLSSHKTLFSIIFEKSLEMLYFLITNRAVFQRMDTLLAQNALVSWTLQLLKLENNSESSTCTF